MVADNQGDMQEDGDLQEGNLQENNQDGNHGDLRGVMGACVIQGRI